MRHFVVFSTFLLGLLLIAMLAEHAFAAVPCLPPTCACSPGNALPPPAVPAICTVTPVKTAAPIPTVTAARVSPPSGGGGGDEDPGVQTTPTPRAAASLAVPVPTLIPTATAVLAPVATVTPVASATPLPKVMPAATGNAGLHASDAAMPRNGW